MIARCMRCMNIFEAVILQTKIKYNKSETGKYICCTRCGRRYNEYVDFKIEDALRSMDDPPKGFTGFWCDRELKILDGTICYFSVNKKTGEYLLVDSPINPTHGAFQKVSLKRNAFMCIGSLKMRKENGNFVPVR